MLVRPPLVATAPTHSGYIFISSPHPPATFPSRISSSLQRELLLRLTGQGVLVNLAYHPDHTTADEQTITAFSLNRGKLLIPAISNIDHIVAKLQSPHQDTTTNSRDLHLYVCTHAARDCRCGDIGSAVVRALRAEIAQRQKMHSMAQRNVSVSEVGHVGGHKYAANVLVYPHGEWLGLVSPSNIPSVLDSILNLPPYHPPSSPNVIPIRPWSIDSPPLHLLHWRGRMGLSKADMLDLWCRSAEKKDPDL